MWILEPKVLGMADKILTPDNRNQKFHLLKAQLNPTRRPTKTQDKKKRQGVQNGPLPQEQGEVLWTVPQGKAGTHI